MKCWLRKHEDRVQVLASTCKSRHGGRQLAVLPTLWTQRQSSQIFCSEGSNCNPNKRLSLKIKLVAPEDVVLWFHAYLYYCVHAYIHMISLSEISTQHPLNRERTHLFLFSFLFSKGSYGGCYGLDLS